MNKVPAFEESLSLTIANVPLAMSRAMVVGQFEIRNSETAGIANRKWTIEDVVDLLPVDQPTKRPVQKAGEGIEPGSCTGRMVRMKDVRSLIRDYSASVRDSFAELLAEYPSFAMRPLGLQIPRSGSLRSGRSYSFHGIGCRFEKDGVVTDMDFGPEGRIDGFDAWRLSLFAETIGEATLTRDHIQKSLNALANAGEIAKSESTLSSHLYFPVPPRISN